MLTSMVLQAAEEGIAQYLNHRSAGVPLQPSRVARLGFYGLCIGGPMGHYLYTALDRVFANAKFPLAQLVRVLTSSLVIMPITIGVFLIFTAIADNLSYPEARAFLERTYFNVLKMAWRVFPLAQILVFKFFPNYMWLPVLLFVQFVFGIYVKYLRAKAAAKAAKAKHLQASTSKPAAH